MPDHKLWWKYLLVFFFFFFLLLLLIVFILLGCLNYRCRNAVQIPLTILRDSPPSIVRLLQHTNLLERLTDFSLD